MSRIYTIGHSTHSQAKLIALLEQSGIRLLADIRRFPASRRHPWFSRESLQGALPAAGIEYRWFEALGGHRQASPQTKNTGLRVAAFRGYADHTSTAGFREAASELMRLAEARPAAFMCAEALYWHCHRMILSDFFTVHGWQVEHILESSEARYSRERGRPARFPQGGEPPGRARCPRSQDYRLHRLTEGATLHAGQLLYLPVQLEL